LFYRDLKPKGIPLSKRQIKRLEAKGCFPRHFNISPRVEGWFEDEIDSFLDARAAARGTVSLAE
jgi:predicted DNA-binding transcriptional regulator AlpA